MAKYDVAIYGLWYGNNYGSIITYYALSKVLESMGKTYAMIRNPLGREIDVDSLERSHPLRFAKEKYKITRLRPLSRLHELNNYFDAFLIGSDQMWNYHLSRPYKQSYFLDFVGDNKIKVAYATSFGKDTYIGPPEEKVITEKNLKRFDAISVRDDFSERICREDFGVHAEAVLDPVFLCDLEKYDELISEAVNFSIDEEYIFAYVLDPNPKIGASIQKIAEESGKKVVVVFNQSGDKIKLRDALDIDNDNVMFMLNPTVKEWLYLFRNAQFVVTDSFHGSCFSIIFGRPFIVMKNNGRGGSRFPYLLGGFGLLDRMVESPEAIAEKYAQSVNGKPIDYESVYKKIDAEKAKSFEWLKNALERKAVTAEKRAKFSDSRDERGVTVKAPVSSGEPLKLHPDIERCRMVVSLVRDYGIRHIVVSSGARDVSLTRFFEANDCFITHNVTDERSAAYYALGLALELKEPVAITCTSGTAVSNYLPGITEAYYMQVPIAVISGDRYPCFQGQMEAQKIDHLGALASVVKASVELPVNWDGLGQWEARRKICEALLEMSHHGSGPVHINVPMNYLESTFPSKEALILSNYRMIKRIEATSDVREFDKLSDSLKKAKRILVISGQADPMSESEKKHFDDFCRRYNCCVVVDHLSNLDNEYCVNPFNLLRKTTTDFFKNNLMPDLVIYFGGKRVLNCPLQGKMRSVPRKFDFWRVSPDGKVADLYRTLTHVIEMPNDYFFSYFSSKGEGNSNDKSYLSVWKDLVKKYPPSDYTAVTKFNSFYTIGKTMSIMPKNSLLHLGVGTSFNRAHFYRLDPSVRVHCNMGTNGIDGSTSAFMGQALVNPNLCFLFIGDLSFFYDMNAIWNKPLKGNLRILLNNDGGAGFLRHFNTPGITQAHNATAKGWVESLGFTYLTADNKEDFDRNLERFMSDEDKPMFFEAFIK